VTVSITVATEASEHVLSGVNALLPQLSTSAAALTLDTLSAIVDDGDTHLLIAEDDGVIVGTLTLVTFRIPTGVRAIIEDVVVDGNTRGKGIGKQLVAVAIERASSLGAKTIDLTSRPSRVEANALYVAMGFQTRDTNVYRYSVEN
jgi:ribosomal protein S18 acetylase RimI-like enzyme